MTLDPVRQLPLVDDAPGVRRPFTALVPTRVAVQLDTVPFTRRRDQFRILVPEEPELLYDRRLIYRVEAVVVAAPVLDRPDDV